METDKQKLEKLENLYEMVMDFEKKSHEKNQKRIRIGLRCLYIIPAIFLFLLMVMKSSKIIFLALWIISLFDPTKALCMFGIEMVTPPNR